MSTIASNLSDSQIKFQAPHTDKVSHDKPACIMYTKLKWQFAEYRLLLYYYLYDEAHICIELCTRDGPPNYKYKLFSIHTEKDLTALEQHVQWWANLKRK